MQTDAVNHSERQLCSRLWLVALLLLSFQLAPITHSAELGSRFYYENQSPNTKLNPENSAPSNAEEIPLEFYQKLNNVRDMSEFIDRFVDKDNIDPQLGLRENNKRSVERANYVQAQPVGCSPIKTIVPLTPLGTAGNNSNTFTYWPACTFVMRCSDCCDSKKVGCQPVETEIVNYRVIKYAYGSRKVAGVEIIPVEKHLSCSVQCLTKAEDCKSFHVYRPDLCSCVCKSSGDKNMNDEIAKCSADNNKIWDEQNCRCLCRENYSCTTGTFFDESDCKCIATSVYTPEERRRLIIKAIPIEPDNSTLYEV